MREYKNTRRVDGKTLSEISKETGIKFATLETRYRKGIRTYSEITKPVLYKGNEERLEMATDKGRRLLQGIFDKGLSLNKVAKRSGVGVVTLYKFIYYDVDISSMRLAKICRVVEVSMDYVMGLKR